jgi:serine/threonine protein kinase
MSSGSSSNVVGVHYRVGKKIGEGSFGVIFEGTNLLNQQQVAIKFEPRKSDAPQLRDEYRTYKILVGCRKSFSPSPFRCQPPVPAMRARCTLPWRVRTRPHRHRLLAARCSLAAAPLHTTMPYRQLLLTWPSRHP